MAFTKITNAGFGLTTGTLVGVAASFSSTVSVGGTLTYEDVTNVDSVGLITARNGIEVTDKGVQVGTGATVDSAAANTLTFLTGGSERLRITSAGKVGINKSSPSSFLHVTGSDYQTLRLENTDNGANGPYIELYNNSTSPADDDYTGIISFKNNNDADEEITYSQIRAQSTDVTDGTEDGNLTFWTRAAGTIAERLRIDSSGRLLIGVTSNYATGNADDLVIGSSSSSTERGITLGSTVASAIRFADAGNASAGMIQYVHNASGTDYMNFYTDNAERLRIDSSGRLLLGTTTEGSVNADDLTIATDGDTGITIRSSASGYGNLFFSDATSGSGEYAGYVQYNHNNNSLAVGANTSTRLTIDSSGRLLIGSPNGSTSQLFQIKGDTGGSANGGTILLQNGVADSSAAAGTGLGGIAFGGSTGNQYCRIEGFADAAGGSNDYPGRIVFSTTADGGSAPVERMRIDSNGTIHMGDRASSGNATHFSTATVNISKPDDIATSFSKAACYLHIGNASSTLNGVYPIGFGFSTNDRTHLPAYIQYITEDAGGAEHGPLTFGTRNVTTDTAPTERARISSDGAFMVGQTNGSAGTPGVVCNANGTLTVCTNNATTSIFNHNSGSNDRNLIVFRTDGTNRGSITSNGSTTAYNTTSDYRLKENVVDLDGAITRVKQLQPRRFNFIADADTTVDGFLAHEAQTVVPEAVTGTHNEVDDDGNAVMQGIDQSKLVPLLTAALQEAIAEIETLKTKVAALEG